MDVRRISIGVVAAFALVPAHAYPPDGADSEAAALARGESVYHRCIGCHSLQRNRTGPRHCGLFGRSAGSVPGYEYSAALRQSGIIWTEETVDEFLAAPLNLVPGTTMGFAGIPDAEDRQSLVTYLKYASRELCDGNSR